MREIRRVESKMPAREKLLRVCAYARVSTGKDAMLHSLSAQISYYSSMIQNHDGWLYSGVYADEAKTGTKDGRENFQRMIEDCRNGKIDMIITKSISRFARNTVTLLETTRELKSMGIGVYFEEQRIYTLSGDGELMMSILASYAQEESLSASENQKWRIRRCFEEGKVLNFNSLYGFLIKNGNVSRDDARAVIAEEIFDRVIAGESYNGIARDLNRRGIPSTNGAEWTCTRIHTLIANEKYIGDALLQKTFVNNHLEKKCRKNKGERPMYYAEGTHDGIIGREKFAKAAEVQKERATQFMNTTRKGEFSTFTGMIKCAGCGKSYRRITCRGSFAWNCTTYMRDGKEACWGKKIPDNVLTASVCDVLQMDRLDTEVVRKKIKQIIVPAPNKFIFHLSNGEITLREWKDPSRKDSWTDEMKEQARQKAFKRKER